MGTSNGRRTKDYHIELKKRYEESEIIFSKIPTDQYLCPYCDNIPELINIHSNFGFLEFNCQKDGAIPIKVDDYLKKMVKSKTYFKEKCSICNKKQMDYKENIFQYCNNCQKSFCPEHIIEHNISHKEFIPINKKANDFSDSFKDKKLKKYCLKCKEKIVNEIENEKHKNHKSFINDLDNLDLDKEKEIIAEKNNILSNIIKFNDLILDSYEKFPYNCNYIINVKNLAESFENEKINSKRLEIAFEKIEQVLNREKKFLDELNQKLEEFHMKIRGTEEKLILKNMNLNDEFLNSLSEIEFINFKKIDLSGNKIQNIKSLKKMNLNELEILNISNNQLMDIEVFKDMNLNNLKELYLQRNKINNIKVFLETSLPQIKSIRIENNNLNKEIPEIKEIQKKVNRAINVEVLNFREFNNNYKCNISLETESILFQDKGLGDKIIKDLSIVSNKFDKLLKLDLRNNSIKNISSLSIISFKSLKLLDLSLNIIEEIDILEDMDLENLEELYLSDNLIKDIYPLKNFESKKLRQTDLKNNQLNDENYKRKNKEIIKKLEKHLFISYF